MEVLEESTDGDVRGIGADDDLRFTLDEFDRRILNTFRKQDVLQEMNPFLVDPVLIRARYAHLYKPESRFLSRRNFVYVIAE